MIKQILQFIQNHWMLCSAGAVVLALLIFEELKSKLSGTPMISAQAVALLLNRENTLVIDLRNQKAFTSGHILGAINIARADIEHNLKKLESHKNKTLILVDDNDSNALAIVTKLQAQGFAKIQVLAGGLPSWKDAQLPLNKL
ncbi:MAG: rhodanese protein [uncultured bacterium]|nr:MAG: rhodanese protein [uncultured bacterium]HBC71558.1 rhodanese-like domain-containing protein [Coxiellaceae bacterium]HBS52244.1 rhodanese-like domain-containing protein [Coxiellaceae bacterium]HBY55347.1 rhodanese-like domain-containing protein [Coxiellaceae bacterium]